MLVFWSLLLMELAFPFWTSLELPLSPKEVFFFFAFWFPTEATCNAEMTKGRRIYVVSAHYNEDTTWMNEKFPSCSADIRGEDRLTQCTHSICDKFGQTTSTGQLDDRYVGTGDCDVVDEAGQPLNRGREYGSYLQFIVNYYDRLAQRRPDDPEYFAFIHGHNDAWHHKNPVWMDLETRLNRLEESLSHSRPSYVGLNNYWYPSAVTPAIARDEDPADWIYQDLLKNQAMRDKYLTMWDQADETCDQDYCRFPVKEYLPQYMRDYNGRVEADMSCQFVVHRDRILARPKQMWQYMLHNLKYMGAPELTYKSLHYWGLEYVIHMILGEEPMAPRAMRDGGFQHQLNNVVRDSPMMLTGMCASYSLIVYFALRIAQACVALFALGVHKPWGNASYVAFLLVGILTVVNLVLDMYGMIKYGWDFNDDDAGYQIVCWIRLVCIVLGFCFLLAVLSALFQKMVECRHCKKIVTLIPGFKHGHNE